MGKRGVLYSGRICRIAALALLVPVLNGCPEKKQRELREKVIRVEVSPLVKRLFRQRIPVQGTVLPVELASISARTDGVVDAIQVSEGDNVTSGQLLFQIDRQNLENAVTANRKELEVFRSELKTARIALELTKILARKAQLDFNRAETLRKTAAISQENYESAEVALRQAEAEISKAQAAVEYATAKFQQQESTLNIAIKNLADSIIAAPFAGTVTEKLCEPGEFVKQGTPILKLENQSQLEVNCFISAIYYNEVIPGKTIGIFRMDGKAAGQALVSYRAPSVDPLSRTFKIKLLLGKDTKLVSGMLCDVELILAESRGLGISSEAVMLRSNGEQVAYAYDNGVAKQLKIVTGITDGRYVEITNAASFADAKIVVKGQTFVSDGDKLVIISEEGK